MATMRGWAAETPREAYALAYQLARAGSLNDILGAYMLYARLGLSVKGDMTPLHNARQSFQQRDAEDYYALPADHWKRKIKRHDLLARKRGTVAYYFAA